MHNSEIDVDLKKLGRSREAVFADIRRRLSVLPVAVSIGQPIAHRLDHMLSGVRAQLAVKIYGDDLDTLRTLADQMRGRLRTVPGLVDLQVEKQVLIPQLKVTPDILKRGQYLYKNRCESCHGAEGKGNGFYNKPEYKQSPNLTSKVVQANSDGELFYKVSNFRDRHPSSRMLYSDEERWMIVAFLRTLK